MRCAPQNPPVSVLIKGFCDGLVERGCAPRPTNFGPESALRCQDSCCTNPPLPLCPCRQSPCALQAIPLRPAGNVKKRMACRAGCWIQRSFRNNIACKGKLLANACDEVLPPGQICQVWNCDNVHWQSQQSSASRFVSPKLELNK